MLSIPNYFKNQQKHSRIFSATVLGAVLLCIGVTNAAVLFYDVIPPLHDANVCYSDSIRYYKSLAQDFKIENLKVLFTNVNFYPPLYMLLPVPVYFFAGIDHDVMALVNMVYVIILILSVYKVANNVYGEPAGLFAAIILATFPSIIGFSRITHMNIALTAMLALSLYALLKTDGYANREYCMRAGLIAGVGSLVCSKYWLYFIGIVLIYAGFSFLSKSPSRMKALKSTSLNFFIFLICAAALPVLYSAASQYFFANVYAMKIRGPGGSMQPYNYQLNMPGRIYANFEPQLFFLHLKRYCAVFKAHMGLPHIVWFLVALTVSVPAFLRQKAGSILWGGIMFPVLLLSLSAFASLSLLGVQERFLLPVLPGIAVIIAGLFAKLSNSLKIRFPQTYKRWIVIGMLILGGVHQMFFLMQHPRPQNSSEMLGSRLRYGLLHAVSGETPVSQLLKFIESHAADPQERIAIVVVFADSDDTAPVALELLYEELRKTKLNARVFSPLNLSVDAWRKQLFRRQNAEYVGEVFASARYILHVESNVKKRTMGRPEEERFESNEILQGLFNALQDDKELIWEYRADEDSFYDDTLRLFVRSFRGENII